MDRIEILQRSKLFDNLLPEEVEMLTELTTLKEFKEGELLFEEGDVGDSLYIIVDGEVDVLKRDKTGTHKAIAKLRQHDFFGEMSLIDKEYRSATVRAAANTTTLFLSNDNLHSFAKIHRDGFTWIVVNIARVLSRRLRDTNEKLSKYF